MAQFSEDMRREIMRHTGCSSQEATDFLAHLGLFFSDQAKLEETAPLEAAIYMEMFDVFSRAAVEQDAEI